MAASTVSRAPLTTTARATAAREYGAGPPAPPPAVARSRAGTRAGLAGGALIALLALSHAANDVVAGMLGALLPTLQRRFELTESALALLVATFSFSSSLTQPLLGGLADRLGRTRVAAAGTIVAASVLSQLGAVPTLPLLFGVLLIGGFGSAAFHPAGTSLARAAGSGRRALAVGAYSAGGTAGIALAPLAALAVVSQLGAGGTPWLMLPAVISGLALLALVPGDAAPQSRESQAHAGTPRRRTGGRVAMLRRALAPALLRGPVGLLSLAELLAGLGLVTFSSAAPLWLASSRGVAPDSPLLGWTLTTFSLAAALGGLLAAALSSRVSPSTLVGGTRLLAPAPLFAVFFLEPGSPPYFAAVALAGALLASGLPVLVVAAQDLAPRSAAAASGMLMGFASGAAGVLYAGIGRLQEVVGLEAAMGAAYLAIVPGAILAWSVLRRHRANAAGDARRGLSEQVATALSCACPQCVCGAVRCA